MQGEWSLARTWARAAHFTVTEGFLSSFWEFCYYQRIKGNFCPVVGEKRVLLNLLLLFIIVCVYVCICKIPFNLWGQSWAMWQYNIDIVINDIPTGLWGIPYSVQFKVSVSVTCASVMSFTFGWCDISSQKNTSGVVRCSVVRALVHMVYRGNLCVRDRHVM